jgi:predicted SprT family Zn-dependent metalloprotease
MEIKQGDHLRVVNDKYLPGNDVKPNLENGEVRTAKNTYTCKCGELHIDVDLPSDWNYISCHKCDEQLPEGDKIHWCHSSRFEIIQNEEKA